MARPHTIMFIHILKDSQEGFCVPPKDILGQLYIV